MCWSTARFHAPNAIGVPLVVDGRDRIVWVAGHMACEDFRVTERTQTVVILKLSRLGEEGDEA